MIEILIAGDYCPQHRVAKLINSGKFDIIFSDVKTLISKADYSVVNLECPVVNGNEKPLLKNGPHLKASVKAVEAIKYVGFNMVTLANNHFYDYGEAGVKETLETCDKLKIATVGGGENIDQAKVISYQRIKGRRFAFLNFCEHEFSIASKMSGGSNPLNPVANYYQIQEAKRNADFVIIIVHGGHEHYQLPSPRMKETYRFFIDAGADVVVNHHQHCYSGYELYHDKPIFYGLGNFSFDKVIQRKSIWNEGYFLILKFEGEKISFKLIPYIQGEENPGIVLADKKRKEKILNNVLKINSIIKDDPTLKKKFDLFAKSRSMKTLFLFEPYNNRYLKALRIRGLLPSLINKKKLLYIFNYITCEAHRDIVIYVLNNKLYGGEKIN